MSLSLQQAVRLAEMPVAEALAELQGLASTSVEAAIDLAHHCLSIATSNVRVAEQLLQLATILHQNSGAAPTVEPWLRYAQARLNVLSGDFVNAEANLTMARQQWAELGETLYYARSALGLTEALAMQGRFDVAEQTILAAITILETLSDRDSEAMLTLIAARQNLATLLSYQERYAEALSVLIAQRAIVEQRLATIDDRNAQTMLLGLFGELSIDTAVYQSYLDRPQEAEDTLRTAIASLTEANALYERGRAHTNLGHIYTRTGRFADALREFDAAMLDILGTRDPDSASDRWQAADVLFLEQAIAHLSLNLLPEAAADLDRAIVLFEQGNRRYEWGQAIYYRALIALNENDIERSQEWLSQVDVLFAELDNRYWRNRVQIARAHAATNVGDDEAAMALLESLLGEAAQSEPDGVLAWDLFMRCEAALLAQHVALRRNDPDAARQLADQVTGWLATAASAHDAMSLYPALTWRALHAHGLAARAAGDLSAARMFFQSAVETVESQRATLPIEDFRTSFLIDKSAMYTDLVLALLDEAQPSEHALTSGFAVIERARSRALLERLLVAVDQSALTQDAAGAERSAAVRQQLAWLYNQLLGERPDSRHASRNISSQIRACEAELQRIEWRLAPWLAEAEPVTLRALQAALMPDERAIVYYLANDEWMAFVIAAGEAHLTRHLCRAVHVDAALAELRFQMGRVEVGGDHVMRHADRLRRGAHSALYRLYDLLVAPLTEYLNDADTLLIVPYGDLHLMPFHALWDGDRYLLECFEVSYAPSVSVELLRRQRMSGGSFDSLAAFALRDPSIPQAEAEAYAVSRYFKRAYVFVDDAARIDMLQVAAAQSDVLHFATHGLFRSDNPFFSALKLADGWVDVRTIYRLPLRARLVVLSACESGAVQVQGADEAIGLARGFLGAGANSLIVSLWNVHDASAAQLMSEFYVHLIEEGLSPSRALCAAQRSAIRNQRHPYYWAPYTAIG